MAVLTLAYVSSFVDRMMLNLLVDPIRRDMGLSDTQISLLMGVSFAVFYTCFGLPLGRLADTTNRSGLIMAGIAVWSLMTAACGLVRTYGQFLLARIGVGVGEAALSPAAYSMITDSFPRERLATAMSVYSTGICLGSGAAMLVGALSIRLMLTVREPARSALYLFVVSLVGLGLGPTLVALTTDYLFRDDLAVAASLGLVGVAALAAAALLLRASMAAYRETCRRLAAWNPFDLHLVPRTAGIECAPE